MKNPLFVIAGYSIESVISAREIALSGKKVHFYKTGKLGYPLDDIRDYIYYEDVIKLNTLHLSTPINFRKLINSTYVFIPYEQLKFVNNRNGLISYPLNRSTFESAEEWEQMELCIAKVNKFRNDLEKANNFLNIYKNFFPKWLYDCLLKYIGVNKWSGLRQSKFMKRGLDKEISLAYLDSNSTGTIYRPEMGYEKLCDLLLEHENIKVFKISLEELKKVMITRHKHMEVALMDNRVDYICNYTYGNFEKVKFDGEMVTNINGLEEFIDIDDGIVLTPMKDYFCISNEEGKVIRIKSRKISEYDSQEQAEISPTNYNQKLYNEYKKIVNLYSGKVLNLDQFIGTVIK